MIDRDLLKHRAEFRRALNNHHYEISDSGVFFPNMRVMVQGIYTHDVNGMDERSDKNIVVTEGLNHMLDTVLHDGTKVSTWYIKLFSANTTPLSTWTAANFTSNANEITSNTEGYSESTAPAFVEAAASAGSISNTANKAAFTIATASSVNVWGAALSSNSTKGGTTGVLMSASKFSAVRTLYNTDIFNVGYTLSLTSS